MDLVMVVVVVVVRGGGRTLRGFVGARAPTTSKRRRDCRFDPCVGHSNNFSIIEVEFFLPIVVVGLKFLVAVESGCVV
jgi:hypothetical protein